MLLKLERLEVRYKPAEVQGSEKCSESVSVKICCVCVCVYLAAKRSKDQVRTVV